MKTIIRLFTAIIFIFSSHIKAQNFDDVNIETIRLSDHVYMLVGAGGNIGISVGDDGVFVIDDQFAPLTPKIEAAIKALTDKKLKFLVNTHHHGDHTGGNANMEKLGANIIAHDNVRLRLEKGNNESTNTYEGLPIITFNDKMNVYINGEKVALFHVNDAHTDGDTMLYFTEGNVLHTGDVYFNGRYPFIDLNSGGTINGYIEAVKQGLNAINDDTKIIPGHGGVSNKEEYQMFLTMLETLKANVLTAIEKGKTEDEVAADDLITKTYDDLGFSWGFINSEKIRRAFYNGLKN
jgi:glyoxylase-like metal-dependent hydrolase (beta-lactamase superfamily II)